MVRCQGQGQVKFLPPGLPGLPKPRIHEIKRHIVKHPAGVGNCPARRFGIMPAAKKLQGLIIKALHAKGQAVDAGRPEIGKFRRLGRTWIGF